MMSIKRTTVRASAVTVMTAVLCVFLYACGGGSADEPAGQPAIKGGGGNAGGGTGGLTTTGSGGAVTGSSSGGPASSGGTTASITQGPQNPSNPAEPVGPTRPAGTQNGTSPASTDSCSIGVLNNGRFSATGLMVTGVDRSSQCPFCSSGESCTSPEGGCVCLIVVPR